jgi:hypothetical protein
MNEAETIQYIDTSIKSAWETIQYLNAQITAEQQYIQAMETAKQCLKEKRERKKAI